MHSMGLPDLSGELAWERIAELATVTDEPPGLTRTFLSPALERSKRLVGEWMREAGLEVFEDRIGNVIGRRACADADAPVVACGSHLDTVRNAGRFDGALGVVAAISAAAALRETTLPYHLEILGFSDEEGVRFQTTYLGSRFYAGEESVAESPTVAQALKRHFPNFFQPPPRRLAAYVEAHIEQGPVLENAGVGLGVVTSIAGQTRLRVELRGVAGHAGTVPMNMRRDALAGAAECIIRIENLARNSTDTVATVGCLDLESPASNVIPGFASFTIDIRNPRDESRRDFVDLITSEVGGLAGGRQLDAEFFTLLDAPATACDAAMTGLLAEIVLEQQSVCPQLASGAGHDAAALGPAARVAMLFVRCRGGVSHHPEEYASQEDLAAAVSVLTDFLRKFRP